MQLEKTRVEQVEKYFPNLICTQSLGHVRSYIFFGIGLTLWCVV